MSDINYQPIACLLVPKVLFQDVRYCGLSTTAKVLYSLLLDRLNYAALNGCVDQMSHLYVIYSIGEMVKDLNCSVYQVRHAIKELYKQGNMIRAAKINGRSDCFYVNDISIEGEKKEMLTIKELLELVKPEEREEIMDKIMETTEMKEEELIDNGCIQVIIENDMDSSENGEELEGTECSDFLSQDYDPMVIRGYLDEEGCLDEDTIEEDASEFAMDLAFGLQERFGDAPDRIAAVASYLESVYINKSMKRFMTVVETAAVLCGTSSEWIEDMYACNKAARRIYLKELSSILHMYLEMFVNKELE